MVYKGPFILHRNRVAVPIHRLLSAASHRSITPFQVKMNLTFMRHGSAVTSQFLCSLVQCGNATQLRRSMNRPLLTFYYLLSFWIYHLQGRSFTRFSCACTRGNSMPTSPTTAGISKHCQQVGFPRYSGFLLHLTNENSPTACSLSDILISWCVEEGCFHLVNLNLDHQTIFCRISQGK